MRHNDGEHFPQEVKLIQMIDFSELVSVMPVAFKTHPKALDFEDPQSGSLPVTSRPRSKRPRRLTQRGRWPLPRQTARPTLNCRGLDESR